MRALLAVALLSSAGCGAQLSVATRAAGRHALACGTRAVVQSATALSPAVLDALAGEAPDWPAQLRVLEGQGVEALLCAVAHAMYDALGGDLDGQALHAAVEVRLAAAGKTLPPLSTPRRRVLARGLVYLREHDKQQQAK